VNTELEREVHERRLTAVLEEVAGDGVPAGLAERVLARVRVESPAGQSRVRATLLAALLMLAGIAVVVATARWRSGASEAPAQDPAPPPGAVPKITITTAMVRAACEPIDPPPPGDGVTRLLAVAKGAPFGMVVAPGVHGASKVDLARLTPREAVGHIAAELGTGVAEFGAIVVVGLGPAAPVERLRCTASVKDIDVRDLGKVLHAKTGMNFVVAGDLAGRVTFDLEAVSARALLDVVAKQLSLDVVGCGSVLALRRASQRSEPPRAAPDFDRGELRHVLTYTANVVGAKIVIDPAVVGIVSVRPNSCDPTDVLTALAAAVGADVRRLDSGVIHVMPQPALPAGVTLVAEGVRDFTSLVEVGDVKISIDAPATGEVRVWVAEAPSLDVLRGIAVATARTLARTETGYSIR